MKTDDFDYELPERCIAQSPAPVRDQCKMLVMDRRTGEVEDRVFCDIIDYLNPGDVLVANNTRVMPARLLGSKHGTGGAAGGFLLREVLVRPGKRLKPGALVDFADSQGNVVLQAEIIDWAAEAAQPDAEGSGPDAAAAEPAADAHSGQRGARLARLTTTLPSLDEALHAVGHTPLPPYIKGYAGDEEMYQTVYSCNEKSAAAPTAGLHFTPELIERIKAKGVEWHTVELEVGLDTFRIVDEDDPEKHVIHTEFYTVSQQTVDAVEAAHARGNRVIAVGTTSVRSLESAFDVQQGRPSARSHEPLHPARLYLPCGGCAHHQLPRAAFNPDDAGQRFFVP